MGDKKEEIPEALENEKEEVPEIEKEQPTEEIPEKEISEGESDDEEKEEPTKEIPEIEIFEDLESDDEIQTVTIFETEKGPISVVHDVTLGDLIISTILMSLLIFHVISHLIRSFRDV